MVKPKKIIHPVLKEFQLQKCGFEHEQPDDFVKSQWQSRTKSLLYLIYRWVVALFFLAIVIASMIDMVDGRYFIYMTNWGILLCLTTTMMDAILVSIWHLHPEYADKVTDSNSMPTAFKVYWGLHNMTLVISLVITIIFWSILFDGHLYNPVSILTHGFNSILMFTDLWVVAYPVRLLHIFLPVLLGVVYVSFSVIYYFSGGVDIHGNHYIYFVLDWSKPDHAAVTVVGVLVLCCILYIFVFYIYKLRVFLYRRYRAKTSDFLPTTQQTSRSPSITVIPTGISMVLGNYGHDNRAFTSSTDKIAS